MQLVREEIDIAALTHRANHPECGAVVTFSGTVRNHQGSRKVVKLGYQAYEDMAQAELSRVVTEACQQWPSLRTCLAVHRLGEMPVGESSVFIAIGAPHRPEAFAALRFVIDTLKQRVPIWKKEYYEDGETEWLHPEDGCCAHSDQ
ncbi:MAG: molybdenum cofactor biosynthesis protein MoaE [Acidobacteria bacterium]|nr:molybdenum cofactor biosynthesis protein MoaE [Acidobacteriota bacterium]